VVLDRWSLEFAEGLPDYRRDLDRLLAALDAVPLAEGGPLRPDGYVLVPRSADRGLSRYAVRDGEALRDSTGRVYVFAGGQRRHVPDLAVFAARGLRWDEVRRVPDVVLAAIPEGAPLGPG